MKVPQAPVSPVNLDYIELVQPEDVERILHNEPFSNLGLLRWDRLLAEQARRAVSLSLMEERLPEADCGSCLPDEALLGFHHVA